MKGKILKRKILKKKILTKNNKPAGREGVSKHDEQLQLNQKVGAK